MKSLSILFIMGMLQSCSHQGSSLDDLAETVLKKKEGIDIKITPVDKEKSPQQGVTLWQKHF